MRVSCSLIPIVLFYLLAANTWAFGHSDGHIRIKTDFKMLHTQLMVFDALNGRYPTSEEGLQALVSRPDAADLPHWRILMPELPTDPWGHAYQYVAPSPDGKERYGIYTLGPSGRDHINVNDSAAINAAFSSLNWDSKTRDDIVLSGGGATFLFLLCLYCFRRAPHYPTIPFTSSPAIPVSRTSRPWNFMLRRLWSIPQRCSIVAWRSWTLTLFSTAR
jgi:type II secretion system protein G